MSAAPTLDPGRERAELATLPALLDTIAGAGVRLGLSADRRHITYKAPRGALAAELRAAIHVHRGALLAALTATPAPVRADVRACAWGCGHLAHWRLSERERRYVCLACFPELAGELAREQRERKGAAESGTGPDRIAPHAIEEGEARRRRTWIAKARHELAAWGEAHDWPALPIADSVSTHRPDYRAPYKTAMGGADGWRRFLSGACGPDLAAACHAAGLMRSSAPGVDREERAAPASASAIEEHSQEASQERQERGKGDTLAALDSAGLWIARPGEELAHITEGIPAPSPVIHAGELLELAHRHGITQLWVHQTWASAAGLPDRLTGIKRGEGLAHPFTDGAIAAGWDMRPAGLASWLHCFQRGTYGAIALILPHVDMRAPWHNARDGRELLRALLAYREALAGYAYRRGPGATGTGLLRALHSRNRVALDLSASATPADFPAPARSGTTAADLVWTRPLSSEERAACAYVHAYDKNAQYLGACAALPVGLGTPEHITASEGAGLTFDKRLAGYWRARIAYTAPAGLPNPFAAPLARVDADGYAWYLSPAIELAAQVGAAIELAEAYVWRSSHRGILTPWYERLRDARAALLDRASAGDDAPAALALDAVKATYRQGIGWLDGGWLRSSPAPEDLYRPDWRHAIIAQAAANLYRELLRVHRETGRTPFALNVDCAYFASASADAAADCPAPLTLGTGLRHVKVNVSGAPLTPVVALLDRLCASGTRDARIIDELGRTLRGERATAATDGGAARQGKEA